MDKPGEQKEAHEIEAALPGSGVSVEEITLPDGTEAEIAVIEHEAPKDNLEVGFNYGLLMSKVEALEKHNEALALQLAAFEAATVAAVEEEAAAIEEQRDLLADVAEEVLPPEHEGANAVSGGEHKAKKPAFHEWFFGGSHGRKS